MAAPLKLTPTEQAAYDESVQTSYRAGLVICTVFVCIAAGLRFYSQYLIRALGNLDNWLAAVSLLIVIATNVLCFVNISSGGGLHLWRVIIEDSNPPQNLILFHKMGWAVSVLSGPAHTLIRLSMLFFLRRIFTSRYRAFKIVCWTLITSSILSGIGIFLEFIFQCLPVDYFWNRAYLIYDLAVKQPPLVKIQGWCMPQTVHVGVPVVLDLVQDVLTLLLPALGLWNLRLARGKKIGIFVALSMGLLAIAVDIVRIWESFQVDNDADVTWDNMPLVVWSGYEFSVDFVCICIPTLAPLARADLRARGWFHTSWFRSQKSTDRHLFSGPRPIHTGSDNQQSDAYSSTQNLGESQDTQLNDFTKYGGTYAYATAKRGDLGAMPYRSDENTTNDIYVSTELKVERDLSKDGMNASTK